jgi:DNA-binding CsgD family transcriptional regulator
VTAVTYPQRMTAQLDVATPGGFTRTLAAFRTQGQMDIAFGGAVAPGGTSFAITGLYGARTSALSNLVIRSGHGLGGKALALARPASVLSYPTAQGITHVYDHAVSQEALETVVSLPVVVDGQPRLVIYLGHRSRLELGDRWLDAFTPMLRRLERDLAVDDEVRRRMVALQPAPTAQALSRTDLADIARELADLTGQVTDVDLRARLEAVHQRLAPTPRRRHDGAPHLAPRELDVLTQVARGCSNQQAADNLGLLTSTVKSYLKTAMRKLHAANRVQAITAARAAGLID